MLVVLLLSKRFDDAERAKRGNAVKTVTFAKHDRDWICVYLVMQYRYATYLNASCNSQGHFSKQKEGK